MVTKLCKKCGLRKSLNDFYRATGTRDGHRSECKACNLVAKAKWYVSNRERAIARSRAWRETNRERYLAYARNYRKNNQTYDRDLHLRRAFGIGMKEYGALLEAQGRACAVCQEVPDETRSLHVDHDHETGKVRGLLCMRCNNALGLFREDPDVLAGAIDYLHRRDPDGLGALADARARELVGAG
jgi:hypothetical protein